MILGFRKKQASQYALVSEEILDEQGQWLCSFHLMHGDQSVRTTDWGQSGHTGAVWVEDLVKMNGIGSISESTITLPFVELFKEIEGQQGYLQRILEMPPLFDGGISLQTQGLIHTDEYKVTYSWVNANGRTLTQCERRGGVLQIGTRKFLLPSHAWKLVECVESISTNLQGENTQHSRLKRLDEIKRLENLVPADERQKFLQPSELLNLKLFYANAFRIEAIPENRGYQIRPVLLRRKEDSNPDSAIYENILPPSEQNKYAEHFSNSTKLLPYYNLGVGKYLIISDQLNRVLGVVHSVQSASAEDRIKFLKNPKAAIAESLDGLIDEEELDRIFSDRVIGIGDWSAKVIPWMQIPPSNWIPEGNLPDLLKGIEVDGIKIQLTPKEAETLLSKIEQAITSGEPFVDHNGTKIPATNLARNAIASVVPATPKQTPDNQSQKAEDTTPDNSGSAVMLVKENLETVEFAVHRVARSLYPNESGIPQAVRTEPKPHQLDAYQWLCSHFKAGSRGVLLADDMGLGKTFQSLIFFAWLREGIENNELPDKPLLIVAPTGLLKNWEAEIELHLTKDLGHLVRVYGAELKKLRSGFSLKADKLRNAGLVLTTYDTLTRYQTSFGAINFTAVIFDEIQKLKNPGIQNYTAACSLNCDFWIGMTGTPVENRLCDLWAVSDVLQPGMLGSIKEFSNKYEKAMLEGGETALSRTLELQDGLIKSNSSAPAFMLRRMKHEKLPGLPPKHIHEHPVVMPEDQIKAYNQVLLDVKNAESRRGIMLEALHKLRAYSLHPDYKKQQEYVSDEDFIRRSARLQSCFKILDEIHKNQEKALIFVEYNEWHRPEFLRDIIKKRYSLKELPMVINGQVDSGARQARVESFQKDRNIFDVMLLSPRAGGVGLTLTAANHVIHLTRWWNPAVEDQATDRIYRIGQDRPVHIHYPMSIHPDLSDSCFDYNLNELLNSKRQLSSKVLIAPPDEDGMMESLMGKTFKSKSSFEIDLKESYILSGQEFEDITLKRLQKFASPLGMQVRPTKRSWDGGADMIVETNEGRIIALVQCKHVSREDKSPEINVDLERAYKNYGCNDTLLPIVKIGITNSSKVSNIDKQWLGLSNLHLIISGADGLKPELIFNSLSA